jgi:hypothetical protein
VGALSPSGPAVLTVDGEPITGPMIDAVSSGVPPETQAALRGDPRRFAEVYEPLLLSQALYRRAVAAGLDHSRETLAVPIALAEREVVVEQLLAREADAAVTDAAIAEAWERRQAQYARPQVHLRMIVAAHSAQGESVAQQLRAGADFATVADQTSIGGMAGGDYG